MVLYTPLGASWLNMTDSMQRILKQRALDGQYPEKPEQIIEWLEAAARGWNRDPTPFEWGGRRAGTSRARSPKTVLLGRIRSVCAEVHSQPDPESRHREMATSSANDIFQTFSFCNTTNRLLDNTGKCKIWKIQTGCHKLSDTLVQRVTS